MSQELFAGKFHLQRRIGKGAMGEVWLAEEVGPRGFKRTVALKRLHAGRDLGDTAIDSFVAEAQVIARLDHPNIVRLIELGGTDDGGLYLVLDFVDGCSLHSLIKKTGALSPAAVAVLGRDVAHALSAVHNMCDDDGNSYRVVHRDVSPANILVSQDGRVKLTDFGVARISGLSGERTETGVFKGKLAYMPPEQAMGSAFDGRADLFALGITLFEALRGNRVRVAETQAQYYGLVTNEAAPKVQTVIPEVNETLAQAIDAATEFRADDRVPTATALANMLEDALWTLGPRAERDAINELAERVKMATGGSMSMSVPAVAAGRAWRVEIDGEGSTGGISYSDGAVEPAPATRREPGADPNASANWASQSGVGGASNSWGPNASTGGSSAGGSSAGNSYVGAGSSSSPYMPSTASGVAAMSSPYGTSGDSMASSGGVGTLTSAASVSSVGMRPAKPSRSLMWIFPIAALLGAMGATALFVMQGGDGADGNENVTGETTKSTAASTTETPTTPEDAPDEVAKTDPPASATNVGSEVGGDEPTDDPPDAPTGKPTPKPPPKGPIPKPTAATPPPDEPAETSTEPGTLQVIAIPWGNVVVDGRPVGQTPIAPVSLSPGNHSVVVSNPDLGATRSYNVTIRPGKPSLLRADLKQ